MLSKRYISAQELLEDSFRLGAQIFNNGFRPDFIIGIWRGGAPVGIAVQELLEFCQIQTDHISIRTSLYSGINHRESQVRVHNLGYATNRLSAKSKLLIVDDVFDTGRSIEAVLAALEARLGHDTPTAVKVATPWFKPNSNLTKRTPDFYLHETEQWLVFPHEIRELSADELAEHKPEIQKIIRENCKIAR